MMLHIDSVDPCDPASVAHCLESFAVAMSRVSIHALRWDTQEAATAARIAQSVNALASAAHDGAERIREAR